MHQTGIGTDLQWQAKKWENETKFEDRNSWQKYTDPMKFLLHFDEQKIVVIEIAHRFAISRKRKKEKILSKISTKRVRQLFVLKYLKTFLQARCSRRWRKFQVLKFYQNKMWQNLNIHCGLKRDMNRTSS